MYIKCINFTRVRVNDRTHVYITEQKRTMMKAISKQRNLLNKTENNVTKENDNKTGPWCRNNGLKCAMRHKW